MKARIAPILIAAGVFALCFRMIQSPESTAETHAIETDLSATVADVDAYLDFRWKQENVEHSQPADDLIVLRRLTLSLMGTVPSLEEIRQFEADDAPDRLERWTLRYLNDPRFADYFAERLARCFVGAENGPFIIFRRDRFVDWLSGQLKENESYDEIIRQVVATDGLWTSEPASNFITIASNEGDIDENMLATRTSRAFLGQSLDCAQCHDHKFNEEIKRSDFLGVAAQFGQVDVGGLGVSEYDEKVFEIDDFNDIEEMATGVKEGEKLKFEPAVPFHPEWLGKEGSPRQKFAQWITHEDNRRFHRAIANRVWGLMFGRPFISPVDDMPNPQDRPYEDVIAEVAKAKAEATSPADDVEIYWHDYRDVLDVLAEDFREHNCDLRRLVQIIAKTKAFRLASTHAVDDEMQLYNIEENWGVFPMTRLRPEQVIGSMIQSSYIRTVNQNSHLFVRFIRSTRESGFVEQYGDLGDQELSERSGTIPQALLRMNGEMTRESIKSDGLLASGRIASMCKTNEDVVETLYLVCVSRRPEPEEKQHILELLGNRKGDARATIVEDVYWALFNSPEFSWNH
jgi:hypothetical protein